MSNHSKTTFIAQPIIRLHASTGHQPSQDDTFVSWRVWFLSSRQQFQYCPAAMCHLVPLPQIPSQRLASSFPVPLPSDGECETERPSVSSLRVIASTSSFQKALQLLPTSEVTCPNRGLELAEVVWLLSKVRSSEVTPKPNKEQWINNSSRQLSQLTQRRSAVTNQFRYDLWVRAVLIRSLWCTTLALPSIFVCSAKTDPLFLCVLAQFEKKKEVCFWAIFW